MELAFFRKLTLRERLRIALGYNVSLRANVYTAHKPGAYDGKMSLHIVSDKRHSTDGMVPEQIPVARLFAWFRRQRLSFGLIGLGFKTAFRRLTLAVRQSRE